nr:nuclease domain-containing protein [Ralstonia insidiosa]
MQRGGALRADLLKMHAYRDAIRRTAGAYVLYPGGDSEESCDPYREYHELLPGLGAFVLRPTDTGGARGALVLRRFIDDVLDHVATRLTKHERSRYWLEDAYGSSLPRRETPASAPLSPDATVLLGFVKSREHWNWIREHKAYNVRAEGRRGGVHAGAALLQSQLLLLYCPTSPEIGLARIVSDAERMSAVGMAATGYPEPRGNYWCVQLQWLEQNQWIQGVSADSIDAYVQRQGLAYGEPVGAVWSEIESLIEGESSNGKRTHLP